MSTPLPRCAGQGRAPEIRNGSEVEEAAEQLRDLLYQAVDAEESDEEDAAGGCWAVALRGTVAVGEGGMGRVAER